MVIVCRRDRWSRCVGRTQRSAVQVQSFAVRAENHDAFYQAVNHAEPVRRPRAELDGFSGLASV
jgi:hypothetical protein